ncbi:MAG: hypothetical protein ACRDOA_09020 [Streptosporangiaceae bacterium]
MGTAAGSTLALALLVCWCVFAAMAGPALSLHSRTEALHQSLAGLPATTDAVQVTAQFQDFGGSAGYALGLLPDGDLQIMKGSATREILQGFASLRLPLAAGGRVGRHVHRAVRCLRGGAPGECGPAAAARGGLPRPAPR